MSSEKSTGILEMMTIDEVQELSPNVCLIPVGSTEPHGPALPYGVDSFNTQEVCYGGTRKANQQGGRVLCLPTSRIGLNNNFRGFPFACRMRVPTFMRMLKDLVNMCSSNGADRIVIFNGHGGNADVIKAVMRDLAEKDSPFVCTVSSGLFVSGEARKAIEHGSPHGGESETSKQLYLNPELVRKEKITSNPVNEPGVQILREFNADFIKPWHLFLPASAGGDATKSSAEKGKVLIESSIEGLGKFLAGLSLAEYDENFPF